jgi:hypothetical protein
MANYGDCGRRRAATVAWQTAQSRVPIAFPWRALIQRQDSTAINGGGPLHGICWRWPQRAERRAPEPATAVAGRLRLRGWHGRLGAHPHRGASRAAAKSWSRTWPSSWASVLRRRAARRGSQESARAMRTCGLMEERRNGLHLRASSMLHVTLPRYTADGAEPVNQG